MRCWLALLLGTPELTLAQQGPPNGPGQDTGVGGQGSQASYAHEVEQRDTLTTVRAGQIALITAGLDASWAEIGTRQQLSHSSRSYDPSYARYLINNARTQIGQARDQVSALRKEPKARQSSAELLQLQQALNHLNQQLQEMETQVSSHQAVFQLAQRFESAVQKAMRPLEGVSQNLRVAINSSFGGMVGTRSATAFPNQAGAYSGTRTTGNVGAEPNPGAYSIGHVGVGTGYSNQGGAYGGPVTGNGGASGAAKTGGATQ